MSIKIILDFSTASDEEIIAFYTQAYNRPLKELHKQQGLHGVQSVQLANKAAATEHYFNQLQPAPAPAQSASD